MPGPNESVASRSVSPAYEDAMSLFFSCLSCLHLQEGEVEAALAAEVEDMREVTSTTVAVGGRMVISVSLTTRGAFWGQGTDVPWR